MTEYRIVARLVKLHYASESGDHPRRASFDRPAGECQKDPGRLSLEPFDHIVEEIDRSVGNLSQYFRVLNGDIFGRLGVC